MANEALILTRISLAQEIVRKLDEDVQFTPANRGMALVTDTLGITDHATPTNNVYNAWVNTVAGDHNPQVALLANTVSEAHGNCDMKAECAYNLIRNRGNPAGGVNTKIVRCTIPGHAFCLLCSDIVPTTQFAAYGIDHFGEEVVICDGWQSDYYAPNVWWPYGRTPGIEAFVWRKKIASNQITVYKVHSFRLV